MSLKHYNAVALEKIYSFKPIPKQYPFRRDVPALVDGVDGERPIYLLCKNRQEMIVEFPSVHDEIAKLKLDPTHHAFRWEMMKATAKLYVHGLEVIQDLLDDIPFGEGDKVFILRHKNQYIVSRPRPVVMDKITCPLWATLIPVEDILFTVWAHEERRGIWQGKEVDVHYAWRSSMLVDLDKAMKGYRCVQRNGLDLAFEVYGHAISKDGSVVGLVSEAAWGRMVAPSDRALIYSALAQLQAAGCLYRGVDTNRFIIAGDKVRLLDLESIEWIANRQELEAKAEGWHWECAERLFDTLEEHGPYGNFAGLKYIMLPRPRFWMSAEDKTLVPPKFVVTSTEKHLPPIRVWEGFFSTADMEPWTGWEIADPGMHDTPMSVGRLSGRKSGPGPSRRTIRGRDEDERPDEQRDRRGRSSRHQVAAPTRRAHPYHVMEGATNYRLALQRAGTYVSSENTTSSIEEVA